MAASRTDIIISGTLSIPTFRSAIDYGRYDYYKKAVRYDLEAVNQTDSSCANGCD
jgi:hypothetical protein